MIFSSPSTEMEDTLNCIHPEGKALMESEDWADVGVIMSVPTLNVPISQKIRRATNITTTGKNKFCYTCNYICFRVPCPAIKLVEFHHQMRVLEVYHHGNHSCETKPKSAENDTYTEENLKRFGCSVGPKKLAQLKMTEEMKNQIETGHLDMNKIK